MGPDLLSWGSKSGEGPTIDLNSMVWVADRAWEGTKAGEVGRSFNWDQGGGFWWQGSPSVKIWGQNTPG